MALTLRREIIQKVQKILLEVGVYDEYDEEQEWTRKLAEKIADAVITCGVAPKTHEPQAAYTAPRKPDLVDGILASERPTMTIRTAI